jgi:hypothetical protein
MNKCINDVRTVISAMDEQKVSESLDNINADAELSIGEKVERRLGKNQISEERKDKEKKLDEDGEAEFSDKDVHQVFDEPKSNSDESDDDADSNSDIDSDSQSEQDSHSRKRKAQSESDLDSSQSESEDEPRKKKTRKVSSAPANPNSMYIPSLTAVGYAINSDSEASDLDEEVAPRKNRRGQKARQAIWEKKYKEKAKHLAKQQEKEAKRAKERGKRDDGWDAKRGATGPREGYREVHREGYRDGHRETGANVQPILSRGEATRIANAKMEERNVGPLHPSWEAKKLLKAKEKNVVDSYAGKKITF